MKPSKPNKPIASLSLDLDNQWSYMKTHGDAGWNEYPSYLDIVVPRVLECMAGREQRITFFVVGQDAALSENHDAIASLSSAGHEIGNHSFRHEPWLHRYSEAELDDELARTEDALEAVTGVRPTGFRGPGYSVTETVLQVLLRRGYAYDASTLPTYIGPLARAFYFRSAKLDAEKRAEREQLFGTWADGRRPVGPYWWRLGGDRLLELPVTTLPGVKMPIHLSYVLYLSGYSPAAARAYFTNALRLCKVSGVAPSILLHPLDFLGGGDVDALEFFPGMQTPIAEKLERVGTYLDAFDRFFDVRPMGEHVADLKTRTDLRTREPVFAVDAHTVPA